MHDPSIQDPPVRLAGDLYRFDGREFAVRSESAALRDYLRWMHGRFFVGRESREEKTDETARAHRATFEILEPRSDAATLLMRDARYEYRWFRDEEAPRFERRDRRSGRVDLVGRCDAFTLAQNALLEAISATTRDALLHAGAVSLDGRGLILPGGSTAGKTTLVLTLVGLGCGFLSDEIAWVDLERVVLRPFPRRVNVRYQTQELLGITLPPDSVRPSGASADGLSTDIEALFPASLAPGCPLRFVVLLDGFAEAPRLEPLPRARALFELPTYSVGRIANPAELLLRYAPLINSARFFRLTLGQPGPTARLLLRLPEIAAESGP